MFEFKFTLHHITGFVIIRITSFSNFFRVSAFYFSLSVEYFTSDCDTRNFVNSNLEFNCHSPFSVANDQGY